MTDMTTSGVRLVPATVDYLNLEEISGSALASALAVANPPSWPPEENGPEIREWFRRELRAAPENAEWYAWYVIGMVDGVETLAGTCGYKGPPNGDGMVEIGYSIVPELRRRGFAAAAVRLLCEQARRRGVSIVLADTLPALVASQGVLIKTGFRRIGNVQDPDEGEVWRYRYDLK